MGKKILLLLGVLMLFLATAAQADILGDTVTIQYYSPDKSSPWGAPLHTTGVVTLLGVSLNLFDNQLVTVFADHVDLVALRDSSFLGPVPFNGVSIEDLTNPGVFTSFSVDPASNVVGFDVSRVSIDGGLLWINYEELGTPHDSLARVDFETAAIPEPASILLFGTGLAGLAGLLRRKLN